MSDLLQAVFRILKDRDDTADLLDIANNEAPYDVQPRSPPGITQRLLTRFLLGLPVVGIGSFIHMILSLPFIGPLHWLARTRGFSRRNRENSDLLAIVVVVLVLVGAIR